MTIDLRRLSLLTLLAVPALACGGDDGGTSPEPATAQAVIDGPSTVQLACDATGIATYSANASTAPEPITGYRWSLAGDSIGVGVNEDIRFFGTGTVEVAVEIEGASGVLDRASMQVERTNPPAVNCQDFGFIWGDPGHMWDGDVTADYEFRLAGDLEARWTLRQGETVLEDLGTGLRRTVAFPGPGVFTLAVETNIGGTDRTYTADVVVRDGEPLAGPGLAGVWRTVKDDPALFCNQTVCRSEFHLLDLETGGLTPPIYSTPTRLNGELCLPGDRMVVRIDDVAVSPSRPDLWIIDRFGRRIQRITTSIGLEQDPDVNQFGELIFVNDTRTDFEYDEPMLYTPSPGAVRYIYPTPNPDEAGFSPSFDPSGRAFALGASRVMVEGEVTRRIEIIDVGSGSVRALHERPFMEVYGDRDVVAEGQYLVWTPAGDLVYTVTIDNPSGTETWRSDANGDDIRRVSTRGGAKMWITGDGRQLMHEGDFFGPPENQGVTVMDLDSGNAHTFVGPDGEPLLARLMRRQCSSDLGW